MNVDNDFSFSVSNGVFSMRFSNDIILTIQVTGEDGGPKEQSKSVMVMIMSAGEDKLAHFPNESAILSGLDPESLARLVPLLADGYLETVWHMGWAGPGVKMVES